MQKWTPTKANKIDRLTNCSYSFLKAQFKYMIFISVFSVVVSSFHAFITNQHDNQLPLGLLAQFVELCTVIAKVMGSNPVNA